MSARLPRLAFLQNAFLQVAFLQSFLASILLCGSALAQQGDPQDGAFSMGPQGRIVRGTITATAADHLTLKTESGDVFQVVVTTNTRLTKDRQPVKLADIHSGDGAGAMGVIDAPTRTVHAVALFVVDAAEVKKLRDDMGKTYISGKVTAIDELELTIHRQDGVNQKIAVDEGTSFRKGGRRAGMMIQGDGASGLGAGQGGDITPEAAHGAGSRAGNGDHGGESITLADIKVGDTVVGPGALKAGVFVPTQLTVLDPSGHRRRSAEGGDSPPSPTPPSVH